MDSTKDDLYEHSITHLLTQMHAVSGLILFGYLKSLHFELCQNNFMKLDNVHVHFDLSVVFRLSGFSVHIFVRICSVAVKVVSLCLS